MDVHGGPGAFRTTHWSVVLAAARGQGEEGREAMEALCRAYWYPLYAYLRRRGLPHEDAEDFTQEFRRVDRKSTRLNFSH